MVEIFVLTVLGTLVHVAHVKADGDLGTHLALRGHLEEVALLVFGPEQPVGQLAGVHALLPLGGHAEQLQEVLGRVRELLPVSPADDRDVVRLHLDDRAVLEREDVRVRREVLLELVGLLLLQVAGYFDAVGQEGLHHAPVEGAHHDVVLAHRRESYN